MEPLLKFNDCCRYLEQRFKEPLPGEKAQLKLSPPYRGSIMPKALNDYRTGAVMLVITDLDGKPGIVFIERADDGKVHSGQIAFPGGKADPTDSSLLHTALRETEEEIGVKLTEVTPVGELTQLYIPPSNFMVNPFVGFTKGAPAYKISDGEVKRIVEIPLTHFFDKDVLTTMTVTTSRGVAEVPCYSLLGVQIWGATSMILSEFLNLFSET